MSLICVYPENHKLIKCHLATVSVLSLVILGLAAHWISVSENWLAVYYNYAALAVATAVLTFTIPAM